MKKFKGTKIVQAEPMNESEAVEKGFARKNEDHHEWREGYHVVYPDGYNSWSPKNVFDEAYKPCETFIDRMIEEHNELTDKLEKLTQFIECEAFKTLSIQKQTLLRAQFGAMVAYQQTLSSRIVLEKLEERIKDSVNAAEPQPNKTNTEGYKGDNA